MPNDEFWMLLRATYFYSFKLFEIRQSSKSRSGLIKKNTHKEGNREAHQIPKKKKRN